MTEEPTVKELRPGRNARCSKVFGRHPAHVSLVMLLFNSAKQLVKEEREREQREKEVGLHYIDGEMRETAGRIRATAAALSCEDRVYAIERTTFPREHIPEMCRRIEARLNHFPSKGTGAMWLKQALDSLRRRGKPDEAKQALEDLRKRVEQRRSEESSDG